jgi:hypothetical protein
MPDQHNVAATNQAHDPTLVVLADRWERLIDPDYFATEGRKLAVGLPQKAEPSQVADARDRVVDWATSIGLMRILDQFRIADRALQGQQQKVDDLREQMPGWEQRVLDRRKTLDEFRAQGVPSPPGRPPLWLFVCVGAVLGLVFGIIGATTIASILQSIWRTEVADPQTFYMGWAVVLSLFVGLVIGTATILTREYATGAGIAVRWGPFLVGLFFAAGLAGYRFFQPGETGALEFHVSGLAVVLLSMEMGILTAIEINNLVALNAWERYHARDAEYEAWVAREKGAIAALDAESKVFDEAKQRLTREYAALRVYEEQDTFYKHAIENLEHYKNSAAKAAAHGFDLGWHERQAT